MQSFRPNYQQLRGGKAADLVRRAIYSRVVGDGAWPLRFVRPKDHGAAPGPSVDLYVHLPFCRSLCPHCPYNKIGADPALIRAYGTALEAEIAAYRALPETPPKVRSLYFGGGTPSLTPELVECAIDGLAPLLAADVEVAIEAHPSDASARLLRRMRHAGVNRISLGIETLDPALLRRLGRRYSPAQALDALARARAAGFGMVDANLIFGIPGQSRATALADLEAVLVAGVDQVSAYPLFTFGHTPAGRHAGEVRYARADERVRIASHRAIARRCLDAGLVRTSVWSFTRPGLTPYSTVTRFSYRGFGAGAGSRDDATLGFNTFSVPAYVAAPTAGPALVCRLTEPQRRAHWLYWSIYCAEVDPAAYAANFGTPIAEDYGLLLRMLRLAGCLRADGARLRLTEAGAIWVHRLQSLFSLAGIDAVWTRSMAEPWPEEIALF